jgi:hypothetical protein
MAQARDGERTAESGPSARPPLRLICIGTGRDGTQSLNHMIHGLFERAGGRTMHEYCCRELYGAFCDHAETGEARYLTQIDRMIAECPYDCIVGNGYAAILPSFAQRCGRDLGLVHIYRADRDACIRSLKKNCELFPAAYRYYSSSPQATAKRMAAFHFGEMTQSAWDRLSLDEKFAWYYDKTHALIRAHKDLFADFVEISTESMNEEANRRLIARLALGNESALPAPAHLNAHSIDIASAPREHRFKMQWLLGRIDLNQLTQDDVYAIDYFLDKFSAWTGYQIRQGPQLGPARQQSPQEIAASLDRAHAVVQSALREIEGLKRLLAERDK